MTGGGRWSPRKFRLTFDDGHPFAGLEVHLRSASMALLLDMSEAVDELGDLAAGGGASALTQTQSAEFRKLVECLAGVVTWWNVDDDDGQPVKPDVDGLLGQEPALIITIFEHWAQRLTSVAPPLPRASGNGTTSRPPEDLSLPMEPLSPSPGN